MCAQNMSALEIRLEKIILDSFDFSKLHIRYIPQSNLVARLAYPIWLICCAQYPNGLTENPPFCNNCPTLRFYFFASLTTTLILV